jgi:hypothetical protein
MHYKPGRSRSFLNLLEKAAFKTYIVEEELEELLRSCGPVRCVVNVNEGSLNNLINNHNHIYHYEKNQLFRVSIMQDGVFDTGNRELFLSE